MIKAEFSDCSELYDKNEYHYSWWGAMLLAKRLAAVLSDEGLKVFGKAKNIVNLLNFLLKSKSDIVGDNDIIVAENPGTTMEQAKEIVKMCPKNIVLINADNDVIAFITKYLQGHRKIFV